MKKNIAPIIYKKQLIRAFSFVFFLAFIISINESHAIGRFSSQSDTIKAWKFSHNPRLAPLFSAVIPGAGQLYNRKYWKPPIIYAGFYGLLYSWNYNQTMYKKFYYASVSFPELSGNTTFIYNKN